MNRHKSFPILLIFLVLLNPGILLAQVSTLDSLRLVVQDMASDTTESVPARRRVLSAYLYQARSNKSPEDIIYAYQQLASLNYNAGDINQALKYYKLYVLELEELTEFEEYKDQQFEKNLYENEIRALHEQISKLTAEVQSLKEEKAINYEKNYLIYIGLRISLVIAIILLIGWIYQTYRKSKITTAINVPPPTAKSKELSEALNKARNELVTAETELALADILVQHEIFSAEEFFNNNKSFRRKLLISLPKGLTSGAGLYLHTIKNQTIGVVFNSASSGAAGGLLAARVYHQLEKIVKDLGITSPALILDQLEEGLAQLFPAGVPFAGGISGGVIAYNNSERTIAYCGAKIDLHEVTQGNLRIHNGGKNPLLFDGTGPERQDVLIDVDRGSNFYLCTESYWRQEGGHDFKPLGKPSFEKTIVSVHKQTAEEQQLVLLKVYEEWLGGNDQAGDVLMFGIML